jgi:hypothetical protein
MFGVSPYSDQADACSQAINFYRARNSSVMQYAREEYEKKNEKGTEKLHERTQPLVSVTDPRVFSVPSRFFSSS